MVIKIYSKEKKMTRISDEKYDHDKNENRKSDKMIKEKNISIVYVFDVLVNLFILLTGIFVIMMGISMMNFFDANIVNTSSNSTFNDWITKIPWIINTIGITVILYSFRRVVKSYLKI